MRRFSSAALLCAACATDPSIVESEAALETAPPELAVPAGNHVADSARAFGFQIYECQPGTSGLGWTFRAPLALLFADDDSLVAIHFGGIDANLPAGPYWQSTLDGSRVHGGNAVSVSNPGSIPLLRLTALDHAGNGIYSSVSYIQRLDTSGGVAPVGSCRRQGARAFVPYSAHYVLWAASLPRPDVPAAIAVAYGNDVAFVGHASGVQTYQCALDATSQMTWQFRSPRADLFDDSGRFAVHFGGIDTNLPAGPYWQSTRDGSRVHGGNSVSAPSPGNIPLLRLQALNTARNGIFTRVSFIQRLATAGGVGPTGACTSADAPVDIPYTADYFFYRPTN